ncbi:MAG: zinc ribbon domain-containing protein [Deltaproteobacteria bacterium]|nr:zinc ribbon domain-containing protein [Candidatus Zymogenaceae bacterium]
MADKIDLRLSKDQFQYIGSLLDGEKISLSPFLPPDDKAPVSEEGRKALADTGVVTAGEKIGAKYKQTFSLLAGPTAFTWVIYGGIGPYNSFVIFFRDKKSVCLFESGDSFRIQDPAPAAELLIMLNQYTGTSFFSASTAAEQLSFDEAAVLFAVIDLRRRQLLADILKGAPGDPSPMPLDVIAEWLSFGKQNRHWLVTRLREYLVPAAVPSRDAVAKALSALTKKRLVTEKDGKYIPSEAMEIVSNRFMILGNNLTIYSGRVGGDNEVTHLKIEVTGANQSDLMLWEITDTDTVSVSFPSPLALTYMLSPFLDSPDFIKDIQGKPLAAAVETDEVPCKNCKMPIAPDSKFCKHCGRVVGTDNKKPEERTCAGCGRKLPADAKFCDGCGKTAE